MQIANTNIVTLPVGLRPTTICTEDDLLQMSESQYMDAAQLMFFKGRLETARDHLVDRTKVEAEAIGASAPDADPVDRASTEEARSSALRTHARDVGQLSRIQYALARIEACDYGWCAETGEPIGLERLLAQPTATLSIDAQQRREMIRKFSN